MPFPAAQAAARDEDDGSGGENAPEAALVAVAPPPAAAKKRPRGRGPKRRAVQKKQHTSAGFVNEDRGAYRDAYGPNSLVTGNVRPSSDSTPRVTLHSPP